MIDQNRGADPGEVDPDPDRGAHNPYLKFQGKTPELDPTAKKNRIRIRPKTKTRMLPMVLTIDGNSEQAIRIKISRSFRRKNIIFATNFEQIKCHKQIK